MRKAMILVFTVLLFVSIAYAQYSDPPGEVVGTTYYPVQSSGNANNRIAVDYLDGIHITWTKSVPGGQPRHVYYNFRGEDYIWLAPGIGVQVSTNNGAGYSSLSQLSTGEAAIAYHNISNNYVILCVDAFRGFGIFDCYDPPDMAPSGNHAFWPQVAVSANGDIHILAAEHTMDPDLNPSLLYTRSTDGGDSWIDPLVADSVALLNGCITASADGRVAIVYIRPTRWTDQSTVKNDVLYVVSEDGREWDFRFPINITEYESDDLFIYCPWGIDAVFDPDGNLHVIWLTANINEDGSFIDDITHLWHYSEEDGSVGMITEMPDPDLSCNPGSFTLQMSMPTLSISPTGDLEVVYVGYVDSDMSHEGDCVGDLYMVYGPNGGQEWYGPFNITATHSPNCLPGDCLSENYPSTAEVITDSVHLTYNMQNLGDVADTVYYMPVAVPIGLGVLANDRIPNIFSLFQNYPNPFNAKTTIEFQLDAASRVDLRVYDIMGASVAVLVDDYLEAGRHSVKWDADGVASGIYYYTLSTQSGSMVKRMILLK